MTEICLYRLFWGGTQVYANLIALFFLTCLLDSHASQLALVVKNLPAKAGDTRETGLIPESQDPLEKEMATCSRILAWKIPWIEDPGRLQPMGSQRDTAEHIADTLGVSNLE